MRKIYIDDNFKCYTSNNLKNSFKEIETDFFNDKCDSYIEGYRFIPSGDTWIRSDGKVFYGEMIAPWKNYDELDAAQKEYELAQLTQYKNKEQELNASYNEGINSI